VTFTMIARAIGIRGFIAIGFAAALALMWWRAGVWQDRAEEQAQAAANERAAHAVTRASLDNLEQRLAVFIADGDRRAEAAARALREQRERSAALDAQIARLRSQVPTAGEIERCETPAGVLSASGL
jgi:ABC-type branched-subunit amino acid transport system ATPase component